MILECKASITGCKKLYQKDDSTKSLFKSGTHLRWNAQRNTEGEFPHREYKQGIENWVWIAPIYYALIHCETHWESERYLLYCSEQMGHGYALLTHHLLTELFCNFHESVPENLIGHLQKKWTSLDSYSTVP